MRPDDRFQQAENELFRLKGQLAAGHLTRAKFDERAKGLTLQDAQGRFWALDPNSGRWHVYDGQRWVPASPSALLPTSLPKRGAVGSHPRTVPAARSSFSRRLPLILGGALLFAVAVLIVLVGAFLLVRSSKPVTSDASTTVSAPVSASSAAPGVPVTSVPVPTATPVTAKDFAALNASLADQIAALNQSELKFIHDMQASSQRAPGLARRPRLAGSELTDQDLKEIAGKALDVAILSDQLGELAGRQHQGSPQAAQSADQYIDIARTGFSLVIDAQNLRTALPDNLVSTAEAVQIIARYGVQLWHAGVTAGNTTSNPFTALAQGTEAPQALSPAATAQTQAQINAGNSSIWIAQSGTPTTRTVNIPAAQALGHDSLDPALLLSSQVTLSAAEHLLSLGVAIDHASDPSQPTQLQVPGKPIAVSGRKQINAGNLPTFQQGSATAVSKEQPGDENAYMQLFALNGPDAPDDQGQITVKDAPALVNLSSPRINITSLKVDSSGHAHVDFSVLVDWSTTLTAPKFEISCEHGEGPVSVTEAQGKAVFHGSKLLLQYPGELSVRCVAYRPQDVFHNVASTYGRIVVSDPAPNPAQKSTDTPTATATRTPTLTRTPTATATKKAKPTATPAPFAMNGTMSINWSAYSTTGFIQLTVDPVSGQVSGSLTGAGGYEGKETCEDGSGEKTFTNHREFSVKLSGTVDPTTGALNLTSVPESMATISTSGGCTDATTMNLYLALALDGTVDLKNHTAKGHVFSKKDYDPGSGDWHAGE